KEGGADARLGAPCRLRRAHRVARGGVGPLCRSACMNPLGQRRVIELAEWTKVDLHGEVLTPADQRLVTALGSSDARVTVQELRDGVRIIAHSGVGIIRFERLEVRIVPKIAGGNLRLVEMIELT